MKYYTIDTGMNVITLCNFICGTTAVCFIRASDSHLISGLI